MQTKMNRLLIIVGVLIIVALLRLVVIEFMEPVQPSVLATTQSAVVELENVKPLSQRVAASGFQGSFGFGRDATAEEIAAWDIDVRADGVGLPTGSGSVEEGAEIYAQQCAHCHGATGTEGPFNVLVGVYNPDNWPPTPLTIGNYWPYATTIYDYVNRSMPFERPGSLEPDEVYALVAWLLHQNEIIDADAVMDAETLPVVEMPALNHWVSHDLRDTYPFR